MSWNLRWYMSSLICYISKRIENVNNNLITQSSQVLKAIYDYMSSLFPNTFDIPIVTLALEPACNFLILSTKNYQG